MQRKFTFSIGEFYHLYNRGVDKRIVFNDENDKKHFIKCLYFLNHSERISFRDLKNISWSDYKRDPIVAIGGYCLMGNHFHILIKEIVEKGISKFMEKLLTAYTMYFNKKYNRTGALFQGTFKANHIGDDTYLRYLYSYIHLNPLKLKDSNWKQTLLNFTGDKREYTRNILKQYHYSSYLDYMITDRNENFILAADQFPDYFSELSFDDLVTSWVEYESFLARKALT